MTLSTIAIEDKFDQWRVKNNDAIDLLNAHEVLLSSIQSSLAAPTSVAYYVRTDGNDSNTGLANTAGGAFLTVQAAFDAASKLTLAKGVTITVNVAAGTYTGQIYAAGNGSGSILAAGGADWATPIILTGPSGVILTSTDAAGTLCVGPGALVKVTGGLRIQASGTTGTRHGIFVSGGGVLDLGGVVFGACSGDQINVTRGSYVFGSANYTINGSAARHIAASYNSNVIIGGRTVTLTGTPTFTAFIESTDSSVVAYSGNSFSGTATGSRFNATRGGSIYTSGSVTYLPGSTAGTSTFGGNYENLFVLGKLDGTDIGTSTAGSGAFTTLSASTSLSAAAASISGVLEANSATVTTTLGVGTTLTSVNIIGTTQNELRGVVHLGGSAIGNESFRVTTVASAVNRLLGRGAVTTQSPALTVDGTDTNVGLDLWTKGTGTIRLGTNGALPVIEFTHTASSVNYWAMNGAVAGSGVTLRPTGSDTNIAAFYESKGTGSIFLRTNSTSQAEIRHVASSVNRTLLSGSSTGNRVSFGADGSDTNIGIALVPKGTGNTQATGDLVATGNVTGFSDERLKENWEDLPENFIEKLANVKSGKFDRKDEGIKQVGVGAQSLRKILPEAIVKSGKWLTVNYGGAAMAACVALAKRVVSQQKEIDDLKRRLDRLEKAR